jgi:hypothetical protein
LAKPPKENLRKVEFDSLNKLQNNESKVILKDDKGEATTRTKITLTEMFEHITMSW